MSDLSVSGNQCPVACNRPRDSAFDLIQFLLLDALPVVGTAAAIVGAGFLMLCNLH